MTRYHITKYLVLRNQQACLHIVAYKGGGRVNTVCGESFEKSGTRTITEVPRHFHVCAGCSKGFR